MVNKGKKEKKTYCGSKEKLPSGYDSFANAEECSKKSQIRRYGKYKIDSRLYKALTTERKADKGKNYEKILIKMAAKRGHLAKNERDLKAELDKKRTEKKFDPAKIKKFEENIKKLTTDLKKDSDELTAMEKEMKGGKLKASLLKQLFLDSNNKELKDVGDYKIDKELSTNWVRVYHNDKDNWTIVLHVGSKDIYDAFVDVQLLLNMKNNARFKESEKIQEHAEEKYDPKRMSVVGSSLGGVLAQEFASNKVHEILTSGRPVTPADLILNNDPKDNQFDVRQHADLVSILKPLQPHKNDLTVKSETPLNPVKSHLGHTTMDQVIEQHGDLEIGHGIDFKKMKVTELKEIIKKGRKEKKLPAKDWKVTKKNKSDLIKMSEELYKI